MKKIAVVLLCFCMLWTAAPPTLAQEEEVILYVSPNGSDAGDGSYENPLATLNGARQRVQQIKRSIKQGRIIVSFLEGEYSFHQTVKFSREDSGTEKVSIIYRAEPGQTVSFTGSKPVDSSAFTPVTDPAIRVRLRPEVRDRVGQLDLKQQGISNIEAYMRQPGFNYATIGIAKLYLDNQEQVLSRWPNEGYALIEEVSQSGNMMYTAESIVSNAKPIVFQGGYRAENWKQAKDAIIEGYFMWDWAYEQLYMDYVTDNNAIVTRDSITNFGIAPGKRFAVFNLLEEIDAPGEFYIDRENLILYYYPPYPITNQMKMDISVLTDDMVYANELSYVGFERIRFEKTRGVAVNLSDCDHISFWGCTFENIGKEAIDVIGNEIDIQSCDFFYIGDYAINMDGGDRNTLTPSNNAIENCHFYKFSNSRKTYSGAVSLRGAGHTVQHNLMHDSPHQAIWFEGNDHKIQYNEIYDVLKETIDAGAIYAGRDYGSRGNEVAFNYIHDLDYSMIARGTQSGYLDDVAIYMDDMFSGTSIHHNVIQHVARGMLLGGGRDMTVYNNIIIDAAQSMYLDQRAVEPGTAGYTQAKPGGEAYNKTKKWPVESSLWLSRYPELKNVLTDPMLNYPANNAVYDNLIYQSGEANLLPYFYELARKFTNNVVMETGDIFKDPETQDYSIQEGADILKKIPGLSEINMEEIGLYQDAYRTEIAPAESIDFRLIAPKTNANEINNLSYFFRWENPTGADRYRLVVAKDAALQDVVLDVNSRYNYYTVEGLDPEQTTYYWQVTALVNGRQMQGEYPASSGTLQFTTNLYEPVDKREFNELFQTALQTITRIVEGEEPGQYRSGTKAVLEQAVDEARKMSMLLHPTQEEIDAQASQLDALLLKIDGDRNVGYKNFGDILAASPTWKSSQGTIESSKTSLKLTGLNAAAGNQEINPESYEILCFTLTYDNSSSWVGMGLRQTHPEAAVYDIALPSDAYLVVIKDDQVELQRFIHGNSEEMIKIVPNTFFKKNTPHSIAFGAVNTGEGVRIILQCDGETVFNEVDTTNPIYQAGAFSICSASADGYIMVEGVDQLPKGSVME
ncbi:right-handed parallel beta-helix repeat-containing protein [Ructibacterium gallinarum]|uniref:Right-handed parallel beta-helix repeat-containing protein n=1 Tax=Ructibacterium gallinarum TaxID=2779355 RepID=A0A9D5LXI7_9FIRM|nr:right-handed parallel beta-helix repeat-containing protein [Ructibacterium gallinarum]MBE5039706.1 right-handed parallel beta-helix repeat-containing protein [Ructibacterium gallinarum]